MSNAMPLAVALIPARAGSKRVPHKNVLRLGDHPLIAYSIAAALGSGVFRSVVVSTDSPAYAEIARHYGADVPCLRSSSAAGETSPDIQWVTETLAALDDLGKKFDVFSILRPTSPFRLPETIQRAWTEFLGDPSVDSLRAVEKCKQHPGKMWVLRGERLLPLLPYGPAEQPWHSSQYQSLPPVYVQNASLEIAWSRVAQEGGTIAGEVIRPFLTEKYEGFDVNSQDDWEQAIRLVESGVVALPSVNCMAAPDSLILKATS